MQSGEAASFVPDVGAALRSPYRRAYGPSTGTSRRTSCPSYGTARRWFRCRRARRRRAQGRGTCRGGSSGSQTAATRCEATGDAGGSGTGARAGGEGMLESAVRTALLRRAWQWSVCSTMSAAAGLTARAREEARGGRNSGEDACAQHGERGGGGVGAALPPLQGGRGGVPVGCVLAAGLVTSAVR